MSSKSSSTNKSSDSNSRRNRSRSPSPLHRYDSENNQIDEPSTNNHSTRRSSRSRSPCSPCLSHSPHNTPRPMTEKERKTSERAGNCRVQFGCSGERQALNSIQPKNRVERN